MGETSQPALSPYEKIAILREEVAKRKNELSALERSISVAQDATERRQYLWGLYPDFYKELPPPDGAKELSSLLEQRSVLKNLLSHLRKEQTSMEVAAKNGVAGAAPAKRAAPPAPKAAPESSQPQTQQPRRKASFASFDDFASQKHQSHGNT